MKITKLKFNNMRTWLNCRAVVTSMLALLFIALALPVSAKVYTAGLKQTLLTVISNDINYNELTGDETYVYVPGSIMGYTAPKGSYTNPYNNTKYSWGDNRVWTYVGQMYFEAGKTYIFGKNLDDAIYFRVDGNVIIDNIKWDSVAIGSFTPAESGWYDVDIRFGNGGGGSGANNNNFGFGYNTDGITDYTVNDSNTTFKPEGGWEYVLDPGDMSLLRTVYSETSWMNVSSITTDGDDIVVTASFTGVPAEATLKAYYGILDGKTFSSDWEYSSTIATIPAGDTAVAEYRVPGAAGASLAAFCLSTTVETATPVFDWSDTFVFADTPVFNITTGNISYTELSFDATCVAIGVGASSVTATVELARDAEFNNIVQTKTLALDNLGSEVVTFSDLTPNAVYYARIVAVNSESKEGTSNVISETTYPAAPAFTVTVNSDHLVPEFELEIERIGLASAIDQVTIQLSTTGSFTSSDMIQTFDVNVTEAPANLSGLVLNSIPAASPLYFRVTAYNDAGYSQTVDLSIDMTSIDGNNVWSGLSEDISDSKAYVFEGGLPEAGKTLYFTSPAGLSPVVNEDTVMPSLRFTANTGTAVDANYYDGYHSCGYDFTGTGVLTFDAEQPIIQASKGTNIIRNPILFNRANNQTVYVKSLGGRLDLTGELMLPEGVTNTTMRVYAEGGEVHFGGPSPDFMGTLFLETSFTLYLDNPHSMTNVNKIYFEGGWGSHTHLKNNTGAPMVFPRCTSVETTVGWSSARVYFEGAPFVFPNATLKWSPRETTQSTLDADVFVKNLIVAKNGSNPSAILDKTGYGALIVTDTTQWDANDCKHIIRLQRGCFAPMTDAAMPPSGEFYVNRDHVWRNTIGLTRDHTPMLDGSSFPRVFQSSPWACWGFTGFGGDRTVCWNNDSSLNMTNTTSGTVEMRIADSVTTNVDGVTYDSYYAYPPYFMFGNRSEFADGTIIFMNPIRYELGQEWDTMTVFESTNHVVAARLRGSIKQGTTYKTWKFSGNSFGGYLALEADNSDFTGKISVAEKGNLLVNSPLVAQAVTVQTGSGLGGTGNMATVDGTTIKSGGALFGGEWNKGGTLTVSGNVTLEANSAIRAEVGSSNDLIGCVKLDSDSVLKLTAPIYVDVDTDPKISPVRGADIKIVDWSEATFDSGSAPTSDNFVARPENNADISEIYLSAREDGLYLGYVTGRVPSGLIIFVR